MASTLCWKCRQRPSSRSGGFCHTCWVAAGRPKKELAVLMRAEQAPEAAPAMEILSDERTDDLVAMEHVWEGRPVKTRQQRGFADLLRSDGRSRFFDRMQRLRGQVPPASAAEKLVWDRVSACPTCERPPIQDWDQESECPTCHQNPFVSEPGPAAEMCKKLLLHELNRQVAEDMKKTPTVDGKCATCHQPVPPELCKPAPAWIGDSNRTIF